MKRVLTVVGTRPNFIKVTQFHKAFADFGIEHLMVHTGQHFDENMSKIFFDELHIPRPNYTFQPSQNSVIAQQAGIMTQLEGVLLQEKPEIVNVVGDVNSTFSAALTCNKLGVPIAHVESGLRSDDRSMPEEINRILTDEITDCFFVTEQSGLDNLKKEGKDPTSINFVGNTMIDTLVAFENQIDACEVLAEYDLQQFKYCLITMHRPATVDSEVELLKLIEIFDQVTKEIKIVFPIHPRTKKNLRDFGLLKKLEANKNIIFTEPIGYLEFQKLVKNSKFCLTDSGGIQEETTFLQIPCITLRPNTERPSTTEIGTNTLLDLDVQNVMDVVKEIFNNSYKSGVVPELWDGKASWRIAEALSKL